MRRIAMLLALVLMLGLATAYAEMEVHFIGEIDPSAEADGIPEAGPIAAPETDAAPEPAAATGAATSPEEALPYGDNVIRVDGLAEITVERPEIMLSYGVYGADSRNQYVVLPIHVLNTSHDAFDVAEAIGIALDYQGYSFEPLTLAAYDAPADTPLGEWTVYETIIGELVQQFNVSIRSIDAQGHMDIQWGNYTPSNATWHPEQSYFVLDDIQTFGYLNGQIAGGGGPYRSVGVRKGASAAQGDANTLSVLEEADYDVVFKAPTAVATRLSNCTVQFDAGGERFPIKLDAIGE